MLACSILFPKYVRSHVKTEALREQLIRLFGNGLYFQIRVVLLMACLRKSSIYQQPDWQMACLPTVTEESISYVFIVASQVQLYYRFKMNSNQFSYIYTVPFYKEFSYGSLQTTTWSTQEEQSKGKTPLRLIQERNLGQIHMLEMYSWLLPLCDTLQLYLQFWLNIKFTG